MGTETTWNIHLMMRLKEMGSATPIAPWPKPVFRSEEPRKVPLKRFAKLDFDPPPGSERDPHQ